MLSNHCAPVQQSQAEEAFRSLLRACGLIRRVMGPYFESHGISGSQWGVLRALHRSEQEGHPGLRLGSLGERLLVRPPSVTGVVERLERMGLVVRMPSATDQRAKDVALTEGGRALVAKVSRGHGELIAKALAGLSTERQGQLQELMDGLSTHLEAVAKELEAHDESRARIRT